MPPSPGLSELGKASDNDMLMDEISLSSSSTGSQSDNQPLSPPAFDDFGMGFDNILIQDDDWWNELCV